MPSRKDVPRAVTPEKLERDGRNLLEYARFAIVFVDGKPQLIDNGFRRKEGLPYAKLIAVLAPCEHSGKLISHADVLEIGYSRTRPYTQIESKLHTSGSEMSKWFIKGRLRSRSITEEEFALAYPIILDCIADIVLECREHWNRKGTKFVYGMAPIERGIHFTVNYADNLMFRQMILADIRYKKDRYMRRHVRRIRRAFRRYKSSCYTPKQLKSFARAGDIAELLSQPYYTPFDLNVLLRSFKEGSHERALLETLVEAFKIDISLTVQEEAILDSLSVTLPRFNNLQCYRHPKQPMTHAQGASVFEVILERSYREQYEIPF